MSKNYTGGLNFTWPTANDVNWASVVDTALEVLTDHNHDGAGGGAQLSSAALASNGVSGAKIRLDNDEYLRARNAANTADVGLLKLSTGNLAYAAAPIVQISSEAVTANGALSVSTFSSTVTNSGVTAVTLAAGVSGQFKLVANNSSATFSVTPSSSTRENTVIIGPYGAVLFVYNTEWCAFLSAGSAILGENERSAGFSGAGTFTLGTAKHVRATGTTYTITTAGTPYTGMEVWFENDASGNVTFLGVVCATGTYWKFAYLDGTWKRAQFT